MPTNRSLPFAILSGVLLVGPSLAVAQSSPSSTSATAPLTRGVMVAVLDVAHVFSQDVRLRQQLQQIRQEAQEFERQIQRQREQLNQQAQKLPQLKPTSSQYTQLEVQLARASSKIAVEVQLKRKEFLEREAREYFDAYHRMQEQVARIATQHDLGLVLRYDGKAIDERNVNSVAQGIQRSVVLQRNLDITPLVLTQMGQNAVDLTINSP